MRKPLPDPDSCRWCAIPQRPHAQQYVAAAGWHKWTAPTDTQRLERMKARRAARLAAKQPAAPNPPDLTVTITIVDTLTPALDFILWGHEMREGDHA